MGWFGKEIGNLVWQWLFGSPVIGVALTLSFSVTIVIVVHQFWPEPPVLVATGQVRIDANPWGEVQWIRGPKGSPVDLPSGRTTPFLTTLPVGTYEAQVHYPPGQASKSCTLQVEADRVATCWFDLAPVDAASYFQKIGW